MTDWIADGESGADVRAKLNDVPNKGNSDTATTGASPVEVDNEVTVTIITSGGTGGNEDIVLPNFTLDGNGVNASKNGVRHIFKFETRTNSLDRIRIFPDSVGTQTAMNDAAGNPLATTTSDGVFLRSAGESATLVWYDYSWFLENVSFNNHTDYENVAFLLPTTPADSETSYVLKIGAGNEGPFWSGDPGADTYQYVVTGGSPTVASGEWRTSYVESGGSAGTESITFGAPLLQRIGLDHLFVFGEQTDPADVISINTTNIKDSSGTAIVSITMDAAGQYILLEAYDTTQWRVVRGTATVSLI